MNAIETLVVGRGLASPADLELRKREWEAAVRATPHGRPIELRVGQEILAGSKG